MHARRLLPLGLLVTVLLVAAGLASHGRPLSGSRGRGPTSAFFDYGFTTLVILGAMLVLVVAYVLLAARPTGEAPVAAPPRFRLLTSLLLVAAASLFAWFVFHAHLHRHFATPPQDTIIPKGKKHPHAGPLSNAHRHHVGLRWDEIAVAAVVLAGLGALFVFTRPRTAPRPPWMVRSREELSAALGDSLDDLRAEPDLRKAIIAAYARMEHALGVAGIRRRPSEAPAEYLARALHTLDASAEASSRLTDLFEWAKFSQHDPEPAMRDEAIDALVAVRDELRHPTAVPA